MLDFTEGWTWFIAGLATTTVFALAVVVFAYVAQRAE